MDIELTSEQRMLADSVAAFVSEELLPLEVEAVSYTHLTLPTKRIV